MRQVVAVVGPTASGKSALGLKLAREVGGEIVNADSRQVYRGMDIGTAKPSLADRSAAPHHLFDVADPSEVWGLALFRRAAMAAFEAIWARGATPLLVGGTGQYVWGLLEDWQVPEVAPDLALRAELAGVAASAGVESLHRRLASVDPLAAERIHPQNVRRVIRALEVHRHTGQPISSLQRKGTPPFDFRVIGVEVERADLDARIDRRVDEMFATGLVDEVAALLAGGLSPDAPSLSSIGYGEVVRLLAGAITRDDAIALTKQATRRFARRQAQWFRAGDARIHWVTDAGAALAALQADGRLAPVPAAGPSRRVSEASAGR